MNLRGSCSALHTRSFRAGAVLVLLTSLFTSVPTRADAAGKPDLVASVVAPATSTIGSDVTVTVATKNVGKTKAAPSVATVYLSKDAARDASDVKLTPTASFGKIKPGSKKKVEVGFSSPSDLAAGSYILIACADTRKDVRESNEKNNCKPARAPTEFVPAPSSSGLIDDALEAGEITEEEALTYHVFSDFGDPRLPARFEGDDSNVPEGNALAMLATEYPTLSLETQQLLTPFLIPPYHEGSWLDPATHARAMGGTPPTYEVRCGVDGVTLASWAYVEAAGGKIRIWWQKSNEATDQARAEMMAQEIDNVIWPKLTSMMGTRQPLSDGGSSKNCRGGSDAYDISLADLARPVTGGSVDGCKKTWARTIFTRSDFGSTRWRTLLAHEIFHAFQWSFDVSSGCLVGGEYQWWMEGTAQWVEDYIYPTDNVEHHFASYLMDEPQLSIEAPGTYIGNERYYGSYLLPFYATLSRGPSFVYDSWVKSESKSSLDAVNAALAGGTGTDGFRKYWKEFALYNWNRPPVDGYKQGDGLATGAELQGEGTIAVGPGSMTPNVPHLAAQYWRFEFAKKVTEFDLQNPFVGNDDASVQVVIRYEDGTSKIEQVTDSLTLCVDDPAIQDIVVIVSNGAMTGAPLTDKLEFEALDGCFCSANSTPPRASRPAGDGQVCEAGATGTITYTMTHHAEEHVEDGDSEGDESITATINLDLYTEDGENFFDRGSTYEFTYSAHSTAHTGDCSYTQDAQASGSGPLLGASGTIVDDYFGVNMPDLEGKTDSASVHWACQGQSDSESSGDPWNISTNCNDDPDAPVWSYFDLKGSPPAEGQTTRTFSGECSITASGSSDTGFGTTTWSSSGSITVTAGSR